MIVHPAPSHQPAVRPNRAQTAAVANGTVRIATENGCQLLVSAVNEGVLRLRFSPDGQELPDHSYALDPGASLALEAAEAAIHWTEDSVQGILRTAGAQWVVQKDGLAWAWSTEDGELLVQTDAGFHAQPDAKNGGFTCGLGLRSSKNERFYGLGDKAGRLNLKDQCLVHWNTDAFRYQADTDPLYKTVPFYIGLSNGKAYGVFVDTPAPTRFDFGAGRPDAVDLTAATDEFNLYLIAGPDLLDVVRRYTRLTGRTPLPPLWALGLHQSKWGYASHDEVVGLAETFRRHRIPCDALYLDIDYMNEYRVFTWDSDRFPQPRATVNELLSHGIRTVAILDPGVKIDPDYAVYSEGLERNVFCRTADGALASGKVWPGECRFPDFTHPNARAWWAGRVAAFAEESGVHGLWNDMNEPALMGVFSKTLPEGVRHHADGNPCSHRKIHNAYGMQMARATHDGLRQHAPNARPFVLTRAAFSGTQRYALTWTGDNTASWEHLAVANRQVQRLNLSGMGFTGSDIGGFIEQPDAELFVRWVQLGSFHPYCRIHSSGHHGDQEPWSFGADTLARVRYALELRMTLLPYWYTAFWQQAQDGTPVVVSLVAVDPADPQTHHRENEFLVGSHLLVAPVVEPNRRAQRAYLPQGTWYAWEDSQTFAGREEHPVAAPLHRIPLFVRAGACIPRYPVQQHVHERPVEELVLDVYGPADGTTVRSKGYFDAGDGVPEPGTALPHELRTWTTEAHASNGWTLHQECSNHSFASFSSVRLRVFGGSPDTPPSAVCDARPVHFVRSTAAWVSEPLTDALDPTETGVFNDGTVWTAVLPSQFTRVDFSA